MGMEPTNETLEATRAAVSAIGEFLQDGRRTWNHANLEIESMLVCVQDDRARFSSNTAMALSEITEAFAEANECMRLAWILLHKHCKRNLLGAMRTELKELAFPEGMEIGEPLRHQDEMGWGEGEAE